MRKTTIWGLAVGAAALLAAPAALAQDQQPAGTGTGTGTASVGASAGAVTPATPAAPANVTTTVPKQVAPAGAATTEPKKEDDGTSDHSKVVGHLGVGYFGVSQIPIASVGGTGTGLTLQRANVNAPVVGVRYWFNEQFGLDAGLGLGITSGSTETVNGATTVSTDKPSAFGLGVHAGVPIALAHQKHFTWMIVPEANFGIASGTIKGQGNPAPPDIDLSGLRIDVGARAGAEIHFGFIGVPQLSLQGSVGVFFRRESIKAKTTINNNDISASDGTNTIGTSVQADPWALFVNNISALYYF